MTASATATRTASGSWSAWPRDSGASLRFTRGDLVAIAVGGVCGAVVRWAIADLTHDDGPSWFEYAPNSSATFGTTDGFASFPTATFIANVAGCLILGAAATLLAHTPRNLPENGPIVSVDAHRTRKRVLLGVATGFCGSLTTFSTFAVELALRLNSAPGSQAGGAAVYLVASVLAGGAAFAMGRLLVGSRPSAPAT